MMAPFRWPDDCGGLDYELLRHTPVSLYFSRQILDQHVAWLRDHEYLVRPFDCSGFASEEDFHAEASRVLGFPDYYGRNLAAFSDCLCSIEVPEAGGTALVFRGFDAFFRVSPECCWHVLDIIACWSRSFLLTGRRLLALVHSDDPQLRVGPVGARPVLWNGAERAMHAREKLEAARKNTDSPEKGTGKNPPPG